MVADSVHLVADAHVVGAEGSRARRLYLFAEDIENWGMRSFKISKKRRRDVQYKHSRFFGLLFAETGRWRWKCLNATSNVLPERRVSLWRVTLCGNSCWGWRVDVSFPEADCSFVEVFFSTFRSPPVADSGLFHNSESALPLVLAFQNLLLLAFLSPPSSGNSLDPEL